MNPDRKTPTSPRADPWAGDAPLRLLVGPYVEAAHCAYMAGAFDDEDALTFGPWSGADVILPPSADFRTILNALPAGWTPDLMLWWRPEYTPIPFGLEHAPFPVAMLTSDWYLTWNATRSAADWADVVVTGTRGEAVFRAAGVDRVVALPMLGFEPGIDGAHRQDRRDIDVLCAGNPRWSIHPEREHVVGALFDLPPTVDFRHPPYTDRVEYNRLLGRTKIFVNQTVVGEINMKCYEVPAAGACLFVERSNLDVQDYLVDGESVVLFDRDDLVEKVLHYLAHDDEREAIARAGQEAMHALSYRDNMRRIVRHLRSIGPEELCARPRPITRHGSAEIARRHAATQVHRLEPTDAEGLARVDACTAASAPRDVAIRALAHLRVRVVADEDGVPTTALPLAEIHELVLDATRQEDHDPALDLLALHLAIHDEDDAETARLFDRLVGDLEAGADLGAPETFEIGLSPDRRFRLARATWEALEAGRDPDAVFRRHLLDACTVARGLYEDRKGNGDAAIELLRRAITVLPEGCGARPALANLLVNRRRFDEAVVVLDEHLARNPLDDAATLNRVLVLLQTRDLDRARRELAAFERRCLVFGLDAWRPTLTRLATMLASVATPGSRASAGRAGAPEASVLSDSNSRS